MPIQTIRYSHEALADYIIAHPSATNSELGLVFERRPQWISVVKNSDAFREHMAQRRAEVIDPVLTATLEDRFSAMAQRSLEVLQDKLEAPSAAVPDELALATARLAATGLGVGGFAPKGSVAIGKVSIDRINILAERLRALNPQTPPVVTVDMPA